MNLSPYGDRSGSTLAQVMVCCLTAPNHYLNQCCLLIGEFLWHLIWGNFTADAQAVVLYNESKNHTFKITATNPRGQRAKGDLPTAHSGDCHSDIAVTCACWPHLPVAWDYPQSLNNRSLPGKAAGHRLALTLHGTRRAARGPHKPRLLKYYKSPVEIYTIALNSSRFRFHCKI